MSVDGYQKLSKRRLLFANSAEPKVKVFESEASYFLLLYLKLLINVFNIMVKLWIGSDFLSLMMHFLQLNLKDPFRVLQIYSILLDFSTDILGFFMNFNN
jgi:hypothetical protein